MPISKSCNAASTLINGVLGDRSNFTLTDLVMEAALPDKSIVGFVFGGPVGFLYGAAWDTFEAPVNIGHALARVGDALTKGTAPK